MTSRNIKALTSTLLVVVSLLFVPASAGMLGSDGLLTEKQPADPQMRVDPSQAEVVRAASLGLRSGEALQVHVDLLTHEIDLKAVSLTQLTLPTEGHHDDPNCLTTERNAWVQVDEPLNFKGSHDLGDPTIPGALGTCRSWGGMQSNVQELTFILAERYGGSVDAIDIPTDSFVVVDCEGSGFGVGTTATEDGPLRPITCEYRQNGKPSTEWTHWDSLMRLDGQLPTMSGYGFGYAVFK